MGFPGTYALLHNYTEASFHASSTKKVHTTCSEEDMNDGHVRKILQHGLKMNVVFPTHPQKRNKPTIADGLDYWKKESERNTEYASEVHM